MSRTDSFHIIFLGDDEVRSGLYLLRMEGDERNCNPSALFGALPALQASATVVTAEEVRAAKKKYSFLKKHEAVFDLALEAFAKHDVVVVDDYDLKVFTTSKQLRDELLAKLKEFLPK